MIIQASRSGHGKEHSSTVYFCCVVRKLKISIRGFIVLFVNSAMTSVNVEVMVEVRVLRVLTGSGVIQASHVSLYLRSSNPPVGYGFAGTQFRLDGSFT